MYLYEIWALASYLTAQIHSWKHILNTKGWVGQSGWIKSEWYEKLPEDRWDSICQPVLLFVLVIAIIVFLDQLTCTFKRRSSKLKRQSSQLPHQQTDELSLRARSAAVGAAMLTKYKLIFLSAAACR